jgi:hypothetical protein
MQPSRRLRVVHDQAGNILGAAFAETNLPKSGDASAPRLNHGGPITSGHAVAELEVPHNLAHLPLQEVVEQLKVARRLVSKDSQG